MRTRRSENGPGLGSQNDESENEIRHSPLKKRLDYAPHFIIMVSICGFLY